MKRARAEIDVSYPVLSYFVPSWVLQTFRVFFAAEFLVYRWVYRPPWESSWMLHADGTYDDPDSTAPVVIGPSGWWLCWFTGQTFSLINLYLLAAFLYSFFAKRAATRGVPIRLPDSDAQMTPVGPSRCVSLCLAVSLRVTVLGEQGQTRNTLTAELPAFMRIGHRLLLVWLHLILTWSLVTTLVYWTLLFPFRDDVNTFSELSVDIEYHLFNTLVVAAEFFLSRAPFRKRLVWVPLSGAVAYVVFAWWLHARYSIWIYYFLEPKPGTAWFVYYIGGLGFFIGAHFLWILAERLRGRMVHWFRSRRRLRSAEADAAEEVSHALVGAIA